MPLGFNEYFFAEKDTVSGLLYVYTVVWAGTNYVWYYELTFRELINHVGVWGMVCVLYKRDGKGGYASTQIDDAEVYYFRNLRTKICSATPSIQDGSLTSRTGMRPSSTERCPSSLPPSRKR